jgi:ferredoxin-NADP reductase
VRLTAEDGYQAQRSYSIASAPEDAGVVITVERLDDGEVSPYLVDELRVGDNLELRGPIGGYFVWEASLGGPLLLLAGGSGVVPFRSILRHHRAIESTVPLRLLYSARSLAELIYRDELMTIAAGGAIDIRFTLTREQPSGWRLRPPNRPGAPGRGRLAAERAPAHLRLRSDGLRGDCGEHSRRPRPPTGPEPHRTIRPHRS